MSDEEVQSLYYSIGEVSDRIGYEPHVLRYWEKEFEVLSPNKDRAGRRRYTEEDVAMIERIRYLLKDEKYTIAGARQAIERSERKEKKRAQISSQLKRLRTFLEELREDL